MPRNTLIISTLLLLGSAATALGCLWDSDTLQMERLRFPGVLEIITGKFVRHSRAYYEWRIIDRTKKLQAQPLDPALIDDLAVAYAKLGQPESGIPLLEKVLEQHPDRYETLSNLGTLLFFADRLEESKDFIRRALEINPDAHFGREQYQLLLTEYLQTSEIKLAGVMCVAERSPGESAGFAKAVLQAGIDDGEPVNGQNWRIAAATRGVLGMMHFADFESPILLEAFGDLLLVGIVDENMTQLAARAYLRAAQGTRDKSAAANYRRMAGEALRTHVDFRSSKDKDVPSRLERQLEAELAAARKLFQGIEAREKQWIAAGLDVDREFAAVYYDSLDQTLTAAQKQLAREWPEPSWRTRLVMRLGGLFCLVPLVIIASISLAVRWFWRRRASHSRSAFSAAAANK